MRGPSKQVFLERRSYRFRRLGDAARMLPVFGLVLLLLPVFWDPATTLLPRMMVSDWLYLFAVWGGLIVVAAILSRGLTARGAIAETRPEAGPPHENARLGE